MKNFALFLIMLVTVSAQASLLSYTAGDKSNNGIVLNKTAALNDAAGKPTALTMDLLGAGLRSKRVLIVDAKVYVAQLFSDNKAGFSRDGSALQSLVQNSTRVALKIDMLRTVSATDLSNSFKEALTANNVAIDAEMTTILGLFSQSADAASGKSLTVLMVKDAQNVKTNLYYEDAAGKTQSMVGSPAVMTKIMSIWLGTPADSGLEKLKASLITPVY
ncbi:MAG: chalcone isomerase family protein [Bdellovibrionaceae bacterium]|nr:chalcone isomerase family protein [Pseudobdellovibrionaceae bacterium]